MTNTTPSSSPGTDSSGSWTGGDVLVGLMREHGVDVAFGVISIHNIPLVEAVDRDLRFVPVRHEAAAVNAADAYARAGGRFGVAITSTGTGAGNAAGSMLEALTAGSRVLHLTGNIDSVYLGQGRGVIHEVPAQLQMLQAVSRHAATVTDARHLRRVLAGAVDRMLTAPHGPASVEIPIDFQYLADPDDQEPAPAPGDDSGRVIRDGDMGDAGLPADLDDAVRLLAGARRPLIWAGGGARDAGAPLAALVHAWGAGLLTSNSGRGVVPEDDPMVLGNFGANPALADLLGDADVLLSVGTHFRSNETKTYRLGLPATHVQVDVDAAALGRAYPVTIGLRGDANAVLTALAERIGSGSTEAGWPDRVQAAGAAARDGLAEQIGDYRGICDSIRARLDRRSPIARDVTIPSSQWGNRLLPMYDPGTNVFPVGGGIGQGLAMGIGAALARPDVPTLVMAGDGGVSVHLGELATLAGARPWCVVVVFNDGGYGVLRNLQDEHSERRAGVDLFTPDFSALASAVSVPYARVTGSGEFDEALARLLAARGPAIIEVVVPELRPAPRTFTPPVHIPGRH